jgi:5-methylcytosine-specific restriction endonuclease McrA
VSLQDRKPMRACGKPYASEEAARDSKRRRVNPVLEAEYCSCGSWHLRKPVKSRTAAGPRTTVRARQRDTGPSAQTRAMVYARDLGCCAGCGKAVKDIPHSIQHRVARGMGGTSRPEANSFENLVVLCGDATTPGGCHLKAEERDDEMHDRGLWLESWERPDLVAVAYATPYGHDEFWLTDDGARTAEPPAEVAA